MNIKGKLIIIGGAEDKGTKDDKSDFTNYSILERFVLETNKKEMSRIEIITTASKVQEKIGKDYIKAFKKLGTENVGTLNINTRDEADSAKVLDRIEKADAVFFTGGDQLRLTTILGGTCLFQRIAERLKTERSFIYAGISAGAAAASETRIDEGNSDDAILKGEVLSSTGFGFIDNVVFDTHFIKYGRVGRLFQIIVTNPHILGVGLEENTGLLIQKGKMEAIGDGMTIIVDGHHIRKSNLLEIKAGAPISIENLKIHVMSRTDVFDLQSRTLKINTPEDCLL